MPAQRDAPGADDGARGRRGGIAVVIVVIRIIEIMVIVIIAGGAALITKNVIINTTLTLVRIILVSAHLRPSTSFFKSPTKPRLPLISALLCARARQYVH